MKRPDAPNARFIKKAFNIDQKKLSRLALEGSDASGIDEIRIGATYDSVVGGGTKALTNGL